MSQSEQLITDHIDIWTSAILSKSTSGRGSNKKYELYGITKLRELILELAVRGKLVAQDANDEPASVLLEKIAIEKAELVKEGKIKKSKPLAKISEDKKIFKLPDGWEWVRLSEISYYQVGKTPSTKNPSYWTETEEGIPWVSIGDLNHFGTVNSTTKKITPLASKSVFKFEPTRAGTILMSFKLTLGKISILEKDAYHNEAIISLYPFSGIAKQYLFKTLPKIALSGNSKQAIMGNTLNSKSLSLLLIPLPPLEEQHRIVAKVDELMQLCDDLEQQTEASIDAHATLVEVLLTTLTDSADASELAENWIRISEHFDSLFTTKQSIEALKQTILRLAVMGKLVPQDPDDEPASVLLEKIAEEKERLVKEKQMKPRKALPPIENEEKLFDLALGWEWCRLDDICDGITSGSTPPKSSFIDETGIPYLKVYNIRNQKIDFEYQPQFIEESYHSSSLKRSQLYPGDVIMNIVGPPLGKIAIIPDTYPQWNCNQAIVMFRPFISDLNKFIYIYLVSGMFLDKIALIGTAGQDNISVTKSRSILLPTPPLAEQLRIVAKVDELMQICDQLSAKLRLSQSTQVQLTDALVEQALG